MQFSVSFDTADSPDLGSLTASEQQAILDTANAAAAIWSRYLTPANVTLDLSIRIDNSALASGALAAGNPGDFVATGGSFGGQPVYDAGSAIKLRTGQDSNGAQADLSIALTVDSVRAMLFKTDDYAPVPSGEVDALSVFLREIAHGLGMYSLAQEPGAPGVSVFDTFVQHDGSGNPVFAGLDAITAYSWASPGVPLDPTSLASIVGPSIGVPGAAGDDLMALTPRPGSNIHISYTDIAILQDLGIPANLATEGDDIVYAIPDAGYGLLDGNDTGYALAGGSSLDGGAGNDRLIGNVGADILSGGPGDDYLEGGGGNDYLWGGAGFDIAHFSGLASDYQITFIGSDTIDISDRRPGAPDGDDRLSGIEEVQWGDGSFTLFNTAPIPEARNISAHSNQTLVLPNLFSVTDGNGDTITNYRVTSSGGSNDPQGGVLMVDGVAQQAGTPIYITASQMASATFFTGMLGGTLTVSAFDGTVWSNSVSFTIAIGPQSPPMVTTGTVAAAHHQTLALSSLFSVSDADGDVITRYQLWDSTRDPASGHFVVDGVVQAAGTVIDITAAQLAQTFFVTGMMGDALQIRAFDGIAWSAADNASWAPFSVSVPANNAPVVTTANISQAHGQTLALSSLFSVSDADGDAITRYQLWDSTRDPQSGYFVVDGVVQAAGTVIDITAAQLAQTSFVTGAVGDTLQIRAFDGIAWSAADTAAWSPFAVNVPANNAPVVTTGTVNAQHGSTLALSSLFSVSDADGDSIARYQLWDSSRDPLSGHFVVAGVAQAAARVIEISAAQLAQTSFVTGAVGDALQIRAFDGIAWSAADTAAWSPFLVSVPAYTVPTVTTADLDSTPGQILALSSLFSISDPDGDTMTRYQLWDSTRDASSGHFVVAGAAQAPGTVIEITAAQLAQTSFVTGAIGDNLQIRAFDGFSWSAPDTAAWAPFHISVS